VNHPTSVSLEPEQVIRLESLPEPVRGLQEPSFPGLKLPEGGLDIDAFIERIERDLLTQALRRAGGIQSRAAQLLRTSFRSFRYRLEKLGLEDPQPGEE